MFDSLPADSLLAAILNCVQDAVILLDCNGQIAGSNPAAESIFGYSHPDVVGRSFDFMLPAPARRELQAMLDSVRAGNRTARRKLAWQSKDGAAIEVQISVVPFEHLRRDIGLLIIARDVTEHQQTAAALKRSEESRRRLAAVVENSADAIIGQDLRGTITSWNTGAREIYGYIQGDALGRNISVLTPTDRKHELAQILQRIARGERIDHYETQHQTKDGRTIDVSLSISPISDNGTIVGASSVARDITERKRTEEALRNSEKLAATGRLAASIAHEINNPLESVTNLLYLLEHHPALDENARQYVNMAGEELSRIVHITRQTLGFYRESAVPVPIWLSELLENVLELYSRRIQSRRIRVEKRFGRQPQILGFPGEMRQVFSNLIVNALDAVKDGGQVQLHLFESRDWRRPERHGVRVVVADNGPGIPSAYRRRIFEPFFTTKGERGTGLGLWVSSGIIRKYGGQIRVRSSSNPRCPGTVFAVFLPAPPLEQVKAA